jgi:hypothetical protein
MFLLLPSAASHASKLLRFSGFGATGVLEEVRQSAAFYF